MTAAKGGPFGGRFFVPETGKQLPRGAGHRAPHCFRPGVPARRPPFPRFLSGAFYFSHAKTPSEESVFL